MSKSRFPLSLMAAPILLGAALLVAAESGAWAGVGGQARTIQPKPKIEAAKAVAAIQLARPLGNPVAYGFVQWDGTLRSSSGNVTVEWNETRGRYDIHINAVDYHAGPYITFVTPEGQGGIYLPATMEDNGSLAIRIGKITGEPGIQASFQFVTYKVS